MALGVGGSLRFPWYLLKSPGLRPVLMAPSGTCAILVVSRHLRCLVSGVVFGERAGYRDLISPPKDSGTLKRRQVAAFMSINLEPLKTAIQLPRKMVLSYAFQAVAWSFFTYKPVTYVKAWVTFVSYLEMIWAMKKPWGLGYIGDYTTQVCGDYHY